MSRLRVIVDGEALPEQEARAVWARFSAHMDEHQGDFDGFAAAEGFVSAAVAVEQGTPTLTLLGTEAKPKDANGKAAREAEGSEHTRSEHERSKHTRSKHERSKHTRSKHTRSKHTRSKHTRSKHERSKHTRSKHTRPREQARADDGAGGAAPPRRKK